MNLVDKELMKLVEDVKIGGGEIDHRRFTDEYEIHEWDDKKIEEVNPLGRPIEPGAKVEIYWKQFDEPDYGYIFTLPGFDEEDIYMSGVVHVPNPQGGEKCQDPPEWIYLGRLLSLSKVIKVKIIV